MASKIKPVFIRQPYNYDVDAASDEVAFLSENPTMTQQHFRDEVDINRIVDRFLKTGQVPSVDPRAMYGDFLNVPESYRDALDQVINAQSAFDDLPSHIRERFQNDPAQLLDFLSDDKNREEAAKLGFLTEASQEASPAPAEAPSEPPPAPGAGA